MNPKYLSVLLLTLGALHSSLIFAEVHKWKDVNGKTHYGDAPPLAGTEKIRTDKETPRMIAERAIGEAVASRKCSFRVFNNDQKGAQLAQGAVDECLINVAKTKLGRSNEVRLDAYNVWKDNDNAMIDLTRVEAIKQNTAAQQQNAIAQQQNTAAQRQNAIAQQQQNAIEQQQNLAAQRDQQRQLEDIERKADQIRHTQKFGF